MSDAIQPVAFAESRRASARRVRGRVLTVLAAVSVTVLVVGCSSFSRAEWPQAQRVTPTAATTTTAGAETSSPASSQAATVPAEVAASGSVDEPRVGSAQRTALMDAARAATGVSGKFEVLALASDGAWAAGILRPVSGGGLIFVAWRNEVSGGWKAFWTARKGEDAASAISAADARFSAAVLDVIPWSDVPPSNTEVAAAIKKMVGGGGVAVASVGNIARVRDKKGRWWGAGVAVPVEAMKYDSVAVYIYRENDSWKMYDMGTGLTATDLPADVRSIFR